MGRGSHYTTFPDSVSAFENEALNLSQSLGKDVVDQLDIHNQITRKNKQKFYPLFPEEELDLLSCFFETVNTSTTCEDFETIDENEAFPEYQSDEEEFVYDSMEEWDDVDEMGDNLSETPSLFNRKSTRRALKGQKTGRQRSDRHHLVVRKEALSSSDRWLRQMAYRRHHAIYLQNLKTSHLAPRPVPYIDQAAPAEYPPAVVQPQYARELQNIVASNQRDQVLECGLTAQQINDLSNRDLSPEDYELLLLLDTQIKPKTLNRDVLQAFSSTEVLSESDLAGCSEGSLESCSVCMCSYEAGDELRKLPCGHRFHAACIDHWLTESSTRCPLDGMEVL